MKANIIKKFKIFNKNHNIEIEPLEVTHGMIKATGYLFDKIAYISDCNQISNKATKKLMNLDFLIIDCLRKNKHPSYFNYDDAINFVKFKPKKNNINEFTYRFRLLCSKRNYQKILFLHLMV